MKFFPRYVKFYVMSYYGSLGGGLQYIQVLP